MCRILFVYKHEMSDNQCRIVNRVFRDYANKYPMNLVSMGSLSLSSHGFAYKSAIGNVFDVSKSETLFAHLRVPYMKKLDSFTISEENVQPFIFENRYVVMHNGYIESKKKNQKSDSLLFFEKWRQSGLPLDAYIKKQRKGLLNIIMYDMQTDEFLVYHGRSELPPMYIHKPTRTVSNFKIYDKSIEMAPGEFFRNY